MTRAMRMLAGVAVAARLVVAAPDPDLVTIRSRLLASFVWPTANISGANADIATYLTLIDAATGAFTDLNYTGGMATGWGGYDHCLRMAEMGGVYTQPASAYYDSPTLLQAVLRVFGFWLREQPQDPANWWYANIGCARPVGQLALQFEAQLTAEQVANATAVMQLSDWESWSETGTNAIDIGVVKVCEGLFNGYQNATLVSVAFDKIYSTFAYAGAPPPISPEGPKTDGSYMQHGAQLYNGNYGASWVRSALLLIGVTANTSYNASAVGYGVATHVALEGCQNMIAWPSLQWDVAVIGRQITSPGGQAVSGSTVNNGADAGLLDPTVIAAAGGARASELQAFASRLLAPTAPSSTSFNLFYASDYVTVQAPSYMASIRMISARTAGGECINGQGLQSLHAADGITYLYQSGGEYESLAPTWDWQQLPGLTVQVNGTQLNCSTSDGMGANTMVGGISDGWVANNTLVSPPVSGAAFMDFAALRYGQNLTAKKMVAFWTQAGGSGEGDVLLHFGSGLVTKAGYAITTTVESKLLSGDVTVSADGGATWQTVPAETPDMVLPLPRASGPTAVLVHHDSVGYVIAARDVALTPYPASASLHVAARNVTGNWSSVGTYMGPLQTNAMFTLWFQHAAGDTAPSQGYAYTVLPALPLATFQANWSSLTTRYTIERNDLAVQATYDAQRNVLVAAVYDNTSSVALPAALPAKAISLPFPAAIRVSSYVNTTTGNTTLLVQYSQPDALLTGGGLGHTVNYYMQIEGATLIECAWPYCPGQWDTPKGVITRPPLKYSCFGNGTIHFVNPPSLADEPDAVNPPFACEVASTTPVVAAM